MAAAAKITAKFCDRSWMNSCNKPCTFTEICGRLSWPFVKLFENANLSTPAVELERQNDEAYLGNHTTNFLSNWCDFHDEKQLT